MTQAELAEILGISRTYLSLIENGKRGKKMSLDMFYALSKALDISMDDLMVAMYGT